MYFERLFGGKAAISEASDAEYAVFDDCSISHMPGWKSWFGAQQYAGVKALYRDAINIKWGKPIIWCCQRDPRIDMRSDINDDRKSQWWQDDIDWFDANCMFIHVEENLY